MGKAFKEDRIRPKTKITLLDKGKVHINSRKTAITRV